MKITRFLKQQKIKADHNRKYINWRYEAEIIDCSITDYDHKLREIESKYTRVKTIDIIDGEPVSNGTKTRKDIFVSGTYDVYTPKEYRIKEHRIYLSLDGKYYIYRARKDGKPFSYSNPYKIVADEFKERYGVSFLSAFGSSEFEIRNCVPDPIYYIKGEYKSSKDNIKVKKCSVVDGCSQYPTSACGKLPTMVGSRRMKGTVKPNKEYPFAIYTKSCNVAVYEEFDTHDWVNHPRAHDMIYRDQNDYMAQIQFNPDDDETILMRESNYSLKELMEYYFNIKESYPKGSKERDDAKLVLNAFIGMLHRKDKSKYVDTPFNHLAIIIIARANVKLLEMINKVRIDDIIHVCVDGFIFQGKYDIGTTERKLGNFEREFTDCYIALRGTNQYIMKDKDGKIVKLAHSGFTHDGNDEPFDPFGDNVNKDYDYADMFNWYKLNVDEDYYELIDDYRLGEI